jgi:hypothetical protein
MFALWASSDSRQVFLACPNLTTTCSRASCEKTSQYKQGTSKKQKL